MKILVIADMESKALWDYFEPEKLEDVDLIISCGDLNPRYLEFLVTMAHCPLVYVHGNHDGAYEKDPPEGCECIEDMIYRYKGLRILGLGGSMRYKEGSCMYTEGQMRMRALKGRLRAFLTGGIDILVHRGLACFNNLMQALHPRLMLHGHVHKSYGHFTREIEHPSGTRIVNAYEYCYVETEEPAGVS